MEARQCLEVRWAENDRLINNCLSEGAENCFVMNSCPSPEKYQYGFHFRGAVQETLGELRRRIRLSFVLLFTYVLSSHYVCFVITVHQARLHVHALQIWVLRTSLERLYSITLFCDYQCTQKYISSHQARLQLDDMQVWVLVAQVR